ncbi:MAG: hypothetical protein KDA92_02420 [Planctomycetales bacterium]|nr:hypothetical protein [Planctomycetales bacterium]MCA9166551.1 hypothetical protein [Planctomycetales bacterium]
MSEAAAQVPKDDTSSSDVDKRRIAEKRSHLRITLLIPFAVAGLLIVGVSLVMRLHLRATNPSSSQRSISVDNIVDPFRGVVGRFSDRNAESSAEAQRATLERIRAELKQVDSVLQVADIRRAGEAFDATSDAWRQRLASLAVNDDGQRIVADESTWQRLQALVSLANETVNLEWRFELEQLHDEIISSIWESDATSQSVMSLHDRVHQAQSELKAYDAELTQFIDAVASHPLPAQRVGHIFDFQEHQRELELKAAAEEAERIENQTIDTAVAELNRKQSALLADAQQLEQQLAALQQGAQLPIAISHTAQRPIQSAQAYRPHLPEIRQLLKPFVSSGYAQPAGRDQFVFERVPRPMSYSAIADAGALEDSQAGLVALFRVGGWKSQNQQNDRPLGTFPRMNSAAELSKPDIDSRVRRAQWLLRVFGHNLVADGMLAE